MLSVKTAKAAEFIEASLKEISLSEHERPRNRRGFFVPALVTTLDDVDRDGMIDEPCGASFVVEPLERLTPDIAHA